MTELRDYQADMVGRLEHLPSSAKVLVVSPTGAGKTIIAAELINRVVAIGERALVIAHRREIIRQTADKLIAAGLKPGIVMAGFERELRPMASVQVASIQTLHARAMRSNKIPMPAATLLIIDEAHHARARTYQAVIDEYPNALVVGFTATPVRGDGRGLGNIFTQILETPQIPDLIPPGYLVDCTVYAPVSKDIAKGVRLSQGDYSQRHLGKRMNTPELVGAIIPHWFKHANNERTVCFASDVDHSIAIAHEFVAAGVVAEHIDARTPKEDRDAILARLASGETRVVSNYGILTEGWDCPPVSVCVLARPTKQQGLFRQMVGRILRPDPATGKTRAILLDHAGATWNHGFITDRMQWALQVDQRAQNLTAKARKTREEKLRECPQCKAVMITPPCSQCGWKPVPRRGEDRDFIEGELALVINGQAHACEMPRAAQLQLYRELRGFAHARGMKGADGWAFYKCQDKGFKPPWAWKTDYSPLPPSPAVASWARSRLIAYAKSRSPA